MERTLHGITWRDDLAWMEPMAGSRWNAFVRAEQAHWSAAIADQTEQIHLLTTELKEAKTMFQAPMFRAGGAAVSVRGTEALTWAWPESTVHTAADLVATKDGLWAIEDSDSTEYPNQLSFYKTGADVSTWCKKGVGVGVAIVGGRCYGLKTKKRIVSWQLVSWDALTGKDEKVEYEEGDYRYNLYIYRAATSAYLVRSTGSKQDAFRLGSDAPTPLEGICLESRRFIFGEGGWLSWTAATGWTTHGLTLKFPSWTKQVPESLNTRLGLLVTRWKGKRFLWSVSRRLPTCIWEGYGTVFVDTWDGTWIRIQQPALPAVWYDLARPRMLYPYYTELPPLFRGTQTPTRHVPYFIASLAKYPTRLLVVGYGAYGSPTSMNLAHFAPLLTRGWAVVSGMWRGGGDHTPEWEDAGRLGGREQVLDDAEEVVRSAQAALGLGAEVTWLYGRSAGGLWVGGLVARYAGGELARGVYMEVPYLDVLRTTTNRTLPLTEIETDEFGLPEQRISDFAGMLRWSPMEMLGGAGTPGVAQILRTGLNDNQVLAYEPAKWVMRSRGKAKAKTKTKALPIFLAIQGDQGHFVHGDQGASQEAEDLALILKISSSDIR